MSDLLYDPQELPPLPTNIDDTGEFIEDEPPAIDALLDNTQPVEEIELSGETQPTNPITSSANSTDINKKNHNTSDLPPIDSDFLIDSPESLPVLQADIEFIEEESDEVIPVPVNIGLNLVNSNDFFKETVRKDRPASKSANHLRQKLANKSSNKQKQVKQRTAGDVGDSINIIKPSDISKPTTIKSDGRYLSGERDDSLYELSGEVGLFSLDDTSETSVASPTAGEFISAYYRLINILITKVSLNHLLEVFDETERPTNLTLLDGCARTTGIHHNTRYSFDNIYRHCINNDILEQLRFLYETKVIHLSDMTVQDVMGAGNGISSTKQANYYLEKTTSVILSSTLNILNIQGIMLEVRDWFEAKIVENHMRNKLQNSVSDWVKSSYKAQDFEYKEVEELPTFTDHHILTFTKRFINNNKLTYLPNRHINIIAITFLLLGVNWDDPNLEDTGIIQVIEAFDKHKELRDDYIDKVCDGYRVCYPINELSRL